LDDIQVDLGMGVAMESRKLQAAVLNSTNFQVALQFLNILAYFSLSGNVNLFRVFQGLRSLLELHHLKDMSGEKYPMFFALVSLVLEGKDERTQRIVVDEQRNWYFDLVSGRDVRVLESLSLYFIIIGVQEFPFYLFERNLSVVGDVKKHVYLVGFLELRNDSDLQAIGLMKEFFIFEAGPTESYLEFFVQNLIVGQPLNAFPFVLRYLQFSGLDHRTLNIRS
jgi:hypothetical protein